MSRKRYNNRQVQSLIDSAQRLLETTSPSVLEDLIHSLQNLTEAIDTLKLSFETDEIKEEKETKKEIEF